MIHIQVEAPGSTDLAPRRGRGKRAGLSLIEILISMFILLFGLMGVAAIFPVGTHYAVRGEQFDRGATLAQSAFEELRARGMLQPSVWYYSTPSVPRGARLSWLPAPVMQPIDPSSANSGMFNVELLNASSGGPNDPHPGHAFVIDPMGTAEVFSGSYPGNQLRSQSFPYSGSAVRNPWQTTNAARPIPLWGLEWPIRRVTFATPDPANAGSLIPMPTAVAESIFRLRDDLTVELPEKSDSPGIQRWETLDPQNTPDYTADDVPLARAYTGNYSWLATIVPTTPSAVEGLQPRHAEYGNRFYDVSVAVFHNRDTVPSGDSERLVAAVMPVGGEVQFYIPDGTRTELDAALDEIRSGNWIGITGVNPANGGLLLKWYKLLSIDQESTRNDFPTDANYLSYNQYVRRAMIDGPEWPSSNQTQNDPNNPNAVQEIYGILLPGVIGVATRPMKMEEL